MVWLADGPCCQFKLSVPEAPPGERKRMSKQFVLVRLLPEKVALNQPRRRTLVKSNTSPVTAGITVAVEFKFTQGAFIDVMQVLFSNVFAPLAARLRMSKP